MTKTELQSKKISDHNIDLQAFKDQLFDLSADFITIPPNRIGPEINKVLELVAEVWGFDSTVIDILSDSGREVDRLYLYSGPKIIKPLPVANKKDIPWLIDKMLAGETVCMGNLPEDLPAQALRDRAFCSHYGVRSALSIPFRSGTTIKGIFSVITIADKYAWAPDLVKVLHYLAELLANALERKRAVERIDEFLRFEYLLSEISATYINLPREEYEIRIRSDLGRLGQLLNADRCILYSANNTENQFQWSSPFIWWPDSDNPFIENLDRWREGEPDFFENFRYAYDKWIKGEPVKFTNINELPPEAGRMKEIMVKFGVKSYLSIPISVAGSTVGALVISMTKTHTSWPEDLVQRLRLVGEVFVNALIRKKNEEKIQNALSEIEQLKERIEADYVYLREEINLEHNFGDIVGKSDALKRILIKVKQVAPTNATVLLLGETGTGKGVMARAIHNASKRKDRPFMQVNCAALTPSLIESELFGHEKGSFTGALSKRVGRFEAAHGTTLFLDEIGDLPLELQPKLLRVLQDGEFERVGGSNTIKTDVRVIAATNRDLEKEIESGRFRRDLWYRLSVFPIAIPPLRERLDDIPLFVNWFVNKYGSWIGKRFNIIPTRIITNLKNYSWPGNIRELENIIERAVITSPENNLQIELPILTSQSIDTDKTLDEFEREYMLKVLEEINWKIEGPNGAANRLGLKPSTLRFRIKKLGIKRPVL